MDDWTPEMDEAMKNISAKADKGQVGGIHYVAMKIQPWEVMESVLTRDEFIGVSQRQRHQIQHETGTQTRCAG